MFDIMDVQGVDLKGALEEYDKIGGEYNYEYADVDSFVFYMSKKLSEADGFVVVSNFSESAKLRYDARPFLTVKGPTDRESDVEKLKKFNLNDKVDFKYTSIKKVDDSLVSFACNPKTGDWAAWYNFKTGISEERFIWEIDSSFYNVSEGVFADQYNSKKKAAHWAAVRKKFRNEANIRLEIERNAERRAVSNARIQSRNAAAARMSATVSSKVRGGH